MRRYDRGHTTYMKINTYTVHVYIYVVFAGTNKSRSCVSQSNQTGKEGRRLTGVHSHGFCIHDHLRTATYVIYNLIIICVLWM